MLTTAQVRSASLHAATFGGGVLAAVSFMASHSVDLYAAYDALGTVWKDVQALIATVTPIASSAYAVYKASTTEKLKDVASDPGVKGVVTDASIAAAVPSSKVQASFASLPLAAKM